MSDNWFVWTQQGRAGGVGLTEISELGAGRRDRGDIERLLRFRYGQVAEPPAALPGFYERNPSLVMQQLDDERWLVVIRGVGGPYTPAGTVQVVVAPRGWTAAETWSAATSAFVVGEGDGEPWVHPGDLGAGGRAARVTGTHAHDTLAAQLSFVVAGQREGNPLLRLAESPRGMLAVIGRLLECVPEAVARRGIWATLGDVKLNDKLTPCVVGSSRETTVVRDTGFGAPPERDPEILSQIRWLEQRDHPVPEDPDVRWLVGHRLSIEPEAVQGGVDGLPALVELIKLIGRNRDQVTAELRRGEPLVAAQRAHSETWWPDAARLEGFGFREALGLAVANPDWERAVTMLSRQVSSERDWLDVAKAVRDRKLPNSGPIAELMARPSDRVRDWIVRDWLTGDEAARRVASTAPPAVPSQAERQTYDPAGAAARVPAHPGETAGRRLPQRQAAPDDVRSEQGPPVDGRQWAFWKREVHKDRDGGRQDQVRQHEGGQSDGRHGSAPQPTDVEGRVVPAVASARLARWILVGVVFILIGVIVDIALTSAILSGGAVAVPR